jgi:hypothetical protein
MEWPGHGQFKDTGTRIRATFSMRADRTDWVRGNIVQSGEDNIHEFVQTLVPLRVYVFNAERYGIGRCQLQDTDILSPGCQNLPAVLFKLNKNRLLFDKFNDLVRTVFPSVISVTVSQTAQDLEIFLYSVETMRPDLAISLGESGTGISQVLSILYVLMSQRRSVIVIDEPNSFLHPGAVKKLSEIMKLFPQHQYVISTHSPDVISSISPENILLIKADDGESKIDILNMDDITNIKTTLDDVGASIADVFGLEAVIWVEGQTEAECFPAILRHFSRRSPVGLSFVPMRHTSDFEGRRRDPKEAWEIYQRLSSGASLLPIAVAFSFDREGRSEQAVEDMRRQSKGSAYFLPARMYENFLLHRRAIAAVIGEDLGIAPSEAVVAEVLDEAIGSLPFTEVDAAKMLGEVFLKLTEAKLEYRKLRHSVMITRWLLDNDEDYLRELADYVIKIVPDKYTRDIQ